MNFDSVADEAYAVTRDAFVSVRDTLANEARAKGDRALADRIRKLRKPTLAAWLVNQVAREHPGEVDRLVSLGAELRAAHQDLAGDKIRALSKQRNELIQGLRERAWSIARKAGQGVGEAIARQLDDTFEAAVADEEAAAQVRAGRLSSALQPRVSDQWLTAALAATPRRKEPAAKSRPRLSVVPPLEEPERDDREHRAALKKARAKAADTAKARGDALRALEQAEQRAEEAASAVADLRERLDEAIAAERRARKDVTAARKTRDAADRAATTAERELANLEADR
ncbi:hypothetical protein [Amycolatopsis anabasis]|uniref:hypothetical protein n=1 Tax=Amycolatopsis anabasis TaxID=1840409 RepID=UPI001FE7E152|nr:hypothetical protein [Amycolatopsis anabasis]